MNRSIKKPLDDFAQFLKAKGTPHDLRKFALDFSNCIPNIFVVEEAVYIAEKYFNLKYFQRKCGWNPVKYPVLGLFPFGPHIEKLIGITTPTEKITKKITIKTAWVEYREKLNLENIARTLKREATLNDI